MRSPGGSVIPLAVVLLLAACEDQPATAFAPDVEELSPDLTLTIPAAVPERREMRTQFAMEDAPVGPRPARAEDDGSGTYYDFGPEPPVDAVAGIFNEKTKAWFLTGRLSVVGSHDYVGNKGSVDTKANLLFRGATVGTDVSYREDAYPFLWPPWDVHSIWTEARINTDKECGYSGWGDSLHKAWWEATLGGPVFNFNTLAKTSHSESVQQPACPPSNANTIQTVQVGGGDEGLCYIWISYDLETGEVLNQQLLFCTDGG